MAVKSFFSKAGTLWLLFVAVNLLLWIGSATLLSIGVQSVVVAGANALLFAIALFNIQMHVRAVKNPNPHVFSRSIMAGTFIKLMILGMAAVIYLLLAKQNRNVGGLFVGMALYLVYTFFEVKIALQLNKQ